MVEELKKKESINPKLSITALCLIIAVFLLVVFIVTANSITKIRKSQNQQLGIRELIDSSKPGDTILITRIGKDSVITRIYRK